MKKIFLILINVVFIESVYSNVKMDTITIRAKKINNHKDDLKIPSHHIKNKDLDTEKIITVGESLKSVPGVIVKDAGGLGVPTSIYIRGGNANHAQVNIDGMVASDPTTPIGESQIQHFLSHGIDEIEVLRGPQGSTHGTNAVSGVIKIKTKKGSGSIRTEGELRGGSFETYQPKLGIIGQEGKANFNLNLAHIGTDGIVTTPKRLRKTPRENRSDPYANTSLVSRIGYDFNEDCQVSLFMHDIRSEKDFISHSLRSERTLTHQSFNRIQGDIWGWNKRWHQEMSVSYMNIGSRTLEKENLIFKSNGYLMQGQWKHALQLSPQHELQGEGFWGGEQGRFSSSDGLQKANEHTTTIALSHIWSPHHTFQTGTSIRQHWMQSTNYLTWRFDAAWRCEKAKTKLFAGIATGQKNPSLTQKYINFGRFKSNPKLRSEKSLGWEIGVTQPLGMNQEMTVTYFENNFKDLITANQDYTTSINIEEAMAKGVESLIMWHITPVLTSTVVYTYLEAIDNKTHQRLLRRPRHTFSFKAAYTPEERLTLGLKVFATSSSRDVESRTLKKVTQPGYAVVDLFANYKIDKTWDGFVKINNLFDTRYEEINGYLAPGFGVFFGIKASIA